MAQDRRKHSSAGSRQGRAGREWCCGEKEALFRVVLSRVVLWRVVLVLPAARLV